MPRPKPKPSRVSAEVILRETHQSVNKLCGAVLHLAKRIKRLEKTKDRVVTGFADAEAYREIDCAQELEDIDDEENVIGWKP